MKKIIHICFSAGAMANLENAMKQGLITKNKIIYLIDDLSNGPIDDFANINKRIAWQKRILRNYDILKQIELNYACFYNGIKKIDNEDIYIWYGNNSMEICGLFYTLSCLKDKIIKNIFIINISEKTHIDNETIIRHSWVGEISPAWLKWFYDKKEKLKVETFNRYINLWLELELENSNLRIISKNKLISTPEDYFDTMIMYYTKDNFTSSIKILGNVLNNIGSYISDSFISWRIIELIKEGRIDFRGDLQNFLDLEIRNTHYS